MIGIQRAQVLDFKGRVRGALMNQNYLGGAHPVPDARNERTLESKIVIKTVEIYAENLSYGYPAAMMKMIIMKNDRGETIIPNVDQVQVGQITTPAPFIINYGLVHPGVEDKVYLFADLIPRMSGGRTQRVNLCYWQTPEFSENADWEKIIHTITYAMNDNEHSLKVGAALSGDDTIYNIIMKVAAGTSDVQRQVSVEVSQLSEVPNSKDKLSNFYNVVEQEYALYNEDLTNSPVYIDGLPDSYETEIPDIYRRLFRMEDRINGLETSTTSRFVSR